jgi:hypothetical protein
MFQEYRGPCTYTIMAARAQRLDPYMLFSNTFTLSIYQYTYQASIHPVIVRDLEPGSGCLLPLISKKEAVQKQRVFANKRDIRKRRPGVQICGIDKEVTINRAAEQPMIIE